MDHFSFCFFFVFKWNQTAFLLNMVLRKEEATVTAKEKSHVLLVLHFYSELGWINQTHWSDQRAPAHGCIHTALFISCAPCICNERGNSGNQNRAAIILMMRISWHKKHTEPFIRGVRRWARILSQHAGRNADLVTGTNNQSPYRSWRVEWGLR